MIKIITVRAEWQGKHPFSFCQVCGLAFHFFADSDFTWIVRGRGGELVGFVCGCDCCQEEAVTLAFSEAALDRSYFTYPNGFRFGRAALKANLHLIKGGR